MGLKFPHLTDELIVRACVRLTPAFVIRPVQAEELVEEAHSLGP
jgi:hypothetical protein